MHLPCLTSTLKHKECWQTVHKIRFNKGKKCKNCEKNNLLSKNVKNNPHKIFKYMPCTIINNKQSKPDH